MTTGSHVSNISRWVLVLFFTAAGTAHFVNPSVYLQMIPPYIPFPELMNYLSGFFELLFALMVIFPKTRRLGGWGLIAILAAVFPANINMALSPEQFPDIPVWLAWARLPFQAVFIFWVWKAALSNSKTR